MKKRKKKIADSKPDHRMRPKSKSEDKEDESSGQKFDFGGLPDRNLKKNLGCG